MTSPNLIFQPLDDCDETRATLHGYLKILGAIRGKYTPAHPKWWHVSLNLYTSGLTTTNIPHPNKTSKHFSLSLDLRNHYLLFSSSKGEVTQIRLADALPIHEMESKIVDLMLADGISDENDSSKYASHEIESYSIDNAEKYFTALSQIHSIFDGAHQSLADEKSPIQLWPHHFDLSFELFGNRSIEYDENGEKKTAPSQIGVGFAAQDANITEPYFYIIPFPFDEKITNKDLPTGAHWYLEEWKGVFFPYQELVRSNNGVDSLRQLIETSIIIQRELIEA